jgi:acyl-CoA oxidase
LVADVLPDGRYVSMIDNPDQVPLYLSLNMLPGFLILLFLKKCNLDLQRFAAFLSPLTLGRVNIAVNSVYISKVCRKAFSSLVNTEKNVLLMNLTNIVPQSCSKLLIQFNEAVNKICPSKR